MESEVRETGWSKDLETGIVALDEQHHQYFNLLNNYLEKAAELSSGAEQVVDLVEKFYFLREYAKEHFSTEESIMVEIKYPEYESHHQEHLYFLRYVDELYTQLKTKGFSPQLAREVNYYTIEWFIEHIRLTDMKLVKFVQQQSVCDENISYLLKNVHQSLTKEN